MTSKEECDRLIGQLEAFRRQLLEQSTSMQETHRAIYRLSEQIHSLAEKVSAMVVSDSAHVSVQKPAESASPSASAIPTLPTDEPGPPGVADDVGEPVPSAEDSPATKASAFVEASAWNTAWQAADRRIAEEESPARPSTLSRANEAKKPFRWLPEKWETQLASVGFACLGGLTLLVGFVFLARWATPYITPPMRATLCYATSLALGIVGVATRAKIPKFAEPIMAAGMMLAFFTSFAGHFIEPMRCWSMTTSVVLMALTMVLVTTVSAVRRSQPLAILAVVMGLWTAGFAVPVHQALTPAMLVGLAAMGAVLFVGFRWVSLFTLTTIGVYGEFWWWLVLDHPKNDPVTAFWTLLSVLTAYFVIFLVAGATCRSRAIVQSRSTNEKISESLSMALIANRLMNAAGYLCLTSAVFYATAISWNELYVYLCVSGAVIVVDAVFGWWLERKLVLDDAVMMIIGVSVLTLGVADAFDGMTLASVFALEGLCLYLVRLATGQPLFAWLSRIVAVASLFPAYPHIASSIHDMYPKNVATPFLDRDWPALMRNLWTPIFLLTAAVLGPILKSRFDTQGTRRFELASAHLQGCLGGAVLVPVLIGWIDHEFATLATFLALTLTTFAVIARVPMLKTLTSPAAMFAGVTQVYFFRTVDAMRGVDVVAWVDTLPYLVIAAFFIIALLAERHWLAGERFFATIERDTGTLSLPASLAVAFMVLTMIDIAHLIYTHTTLWHAFAIAGGVGAVIVSIGAVGRWMLPVLIGTLWSLITTIVAIGRVFIASTATMEEGLIAAYLWIVIVSLVCVDRLFAHVCRREDRVDLARGASWLMVVLIAVTAMLTTWRTCLPPERFETIGWAAVAVLMMAGGLIGRHTAYRRTGLVVMLLAMARVYLHDLQSLAAGYRIAAFVVLGVTLLVVSFVYSRYRQQIEKWI